ncbi:protein DEFECTIVE IN MERISTEM SILENCING 3-like [Durio zibethinus]|uniref:Protein DEFECTIVE IN MERISTEM SILENCING 3-like n=1 Tax=Durio zibethinus TaxID=66656 RepID=A0A6P5Y9X0_DURZI|nr:protein DEFECTIVE IN MERISTEM SILENCING 3-like [Durio zibethinus]
MVMYFHQMFDAYGNHVVEGLKIQFHLDGFSIQGQIGSKYKVPEHCIAGSTLKNLGFEVVDSKGAIDKTFHADERRGFCYIISFPLPQIEGPLCFKACHSRYTEVYCNVKVRQILCVYFVSTSSTSNLLISLCVLQKLSPMRLRPPLQMERSYSCRTHHLSIMTELESELCKYGGRIARCENQLNNLDCQKKNGESCMSGLQASLEPNLLNNLDYLSAKEEMMKLIEGRDDSAAAILCSLTQGPGMHVLEDVVGVVALLGTVCTIKLSRILAEYLGEDQMLAVVLKSYAAACAFEQYERDGEVDSNGRFHVVCLEDVRPYIGEVDISDPQRKLVLPDPRLPNGNHPPGFIGYAVNMVNLDHPHIDYMTASGCGLRQTLFYRLFSKLQVYETREHIENAPACLKHGALSLDGGILRKNGVSSLGYRNLEIYFPVQMHVSPRSKEISEQIKAKQLELSTILK